MSPWRLGVAMAKRNMSASECVHSLPVLSVATLIYGSQILDKSGLHATSFRIGQITGGAPSGAWATSDWVPSFIKSSLALGAFPDAQGVRSQFQLSQSVSNVIIIQVASWLPMDIVSQAILDVMFSSQAPTIALNIVHPRPSQWSSIIQSVADALHRAGVVQENVPLIPFGEWFERLEQRSKGADADEMANIVSLSDS